jgi:hypothetical protein
MNVTAINAIEQSHLYSADLLNLFFPVFFDNVEQSPESRIIWRDFFPKKWKATKQNLTDPNNVISRIAWHNFLLWAQERIWKADKPFDKDLDEVSRNLFPEVDPILWSRILIFALSPYAENRVKSAIERPWNFGSMGRIRSFSEPLSESEDELRKDLARMFRSEEEREAQKTYELAFLLGNIFDREHLSNYTKEAAELEYPKDTDEERKRLILLNIFKIMR